MSRRLFQYDAAIGYRFVAGLRARVPHESGGYLVRSNAAGFRCDHEFVAAKAVGTRRVLLFGDSYTAGEGVSNGKRFGDRLEQLVAATEVYNFGLPGTGTDQHYIAWEHYASAIEHDLLMIVVLVENIRRVVAKYRIYVDDGGERRCYEKPYFELRDEGLVGGNMPPKPEPVDAALLAPAERARIDRVGRFPRLRRLLVQTGTERIAHRVTGWQPFPEYEDPRGPAWQLMAAILRAWIGEHAGATLLVPLPTYYHVEDLCGAEAYQARFAELAAELDCGYCDPLPELRAYSQDERRRFRFATDPHLTESGHAAVARAVQPAVERLLPVIRPESAHG